MKGREQSPIGAFRAGAAAGVIHTGAGPGSAL